MTSGGTDTRGGGPATDLIGGRYRPIEVIRSDSSSLVWKAFDVRLERLVALHRIRPMAPGDPRADRLMQEARRAASVSHPNLVAVHDVGSDDQGMYVVADLVEAPSLGAEGFRLSPEELMTRGAEVAAALAAVHRRGIVHGRITPSTVMLSSRGAKLDGLGLSLEPGPGGGPAHAGISLADDNYTAPEVLAGHPSTPAGDVYSLAIVLREWLMRPLGNDLDELLDSATATEDWCRPDAQALSIGLQMAARAARGHTANPGPSTAGGVTTESGSPVAFGPAADATTVQPPTARYSAQSEPDGTAPVWSESPGGRNGQSDSGFSASATRLPTGSLSGPLLSSDHPPASQPTTGSGSGTGRSLGPTVAVIGVVAVLALVGLLVIQLFANGLGGLGQRLEAVGDSVDDLTGGPDVTVPSTGVEADGDLDGGGSADQVAEDGSGTGDASQQEAPLSDSTEPSEPGGEDGGGLGSIFDFENPLGGLQDDLSEAIDAGNEAKDTARDVQQIVKNIEDGIKKAEEGKTSEAADKFNQAADKIDQRLDGDQQDQAMDMLKRVARDFNIRFNDQEQFEPGSG